MFREGFHDPVYIDVDEPVVYHDVLSEVAHHASDSREVAIPRLTRIWEYVVWLVIFDHLKQHSPEITAATNAVARPRSVSHLIRQLLEWLLEMVRGVHESEADRRIQQLLESEIFANAQKATVNFAHRRPIIMAMDTLERYDISNDGLMNAMAALVQTAAEFNRDYAESGIHLKVFMSGEVFPYLKEVVLQNPLKSVKSPVYLLWRPRDLLRLICWRFYRYLEPRALLAEPSRESIDWSKPKSVMDRMWRPYFGWQLTNGRGLREHTFAYVLRHTQLRPRQLILMCNAIARRSLEAKRFPQLNEDDIREAVRDAESDLASEIINSFASVYPRVDSILD